MRHLFVLSYLLLTAACDTGPDSDYAKLVPKSSVLTVTSQSNDPSAAVLARAAAFNARAYDLRALEP